MGAHAAGDAQALGSPEKEDTKHDEAIHPQDDGFRAQRHAADRADGAGSGADDARRRMAVG